MNNLYKNLLKRILDILFASIAILVLLPLFLLISILIVIDDFGSPCFLQKRIAKNCCGEKRYFNIFKFRSMKMSTPHEMPTHMLENPEKYITRVGKFLRKTSLDELPQIFNIFLGQMSFVGPRPALWNQDDLYVEREKYGANDVTPGLTGWAQINGRDELSIEKKASFDGYYVKNIKFSFDVKCILLTFVKVINADGIKEGA